MLQVFPKTLKERLRHSTVVLRLIALALLIVALEDRRVFTSGENIYTEGIETCNGLDISGSMLAEDFRQTG